MRIRYIYDVPLPNPFAATTQILCTGEACAGSGHEFSLAAGPLSATAVDILRAAGVDATAPIRIDPVFPGRPRHPLLRPLARLGVLRSEARQSGRVLISRGETALALSAALGPRRPGRPPFVMEVHKLVSLDVAERRAGRRLDGVPTSRLRRAEAQAFARADGLIYLTEGVRTAVESMFAPAGPWAVAPSGVHVPIRTPDTPRDVDVVFAGKIEPRKGALLTLEALARLPDQRLLVVGDGPEMDRARRRAAAPDLAGRVEFAGRVPHADVAALLRRARVGLCPLPAGVDHVGSSFTSPMKLLEMMALGLPVVASERRANPRDLHLRTRRAAGAPRRRGAAGGSGGAAARRRGACVAAGRRGTDAGGVFRLGETRGAHCRALPPLRGGCARGCKPLNRCAS